MKKQFLTVAALLVMGFAANAQVGIGTTTPDASSMLDVKSTTKGLLMPRMTSTERSSIASPLKGLQVFDITTNSPWYFNGTVWVNGASAVPVNYWTLAGNNLSNNSGTNIGIGTSSPAGQFANNSENVVGSQGVGLDGASSFNWEIPGTSTGGFTGSFYNKSTVGGANGLSVKVASTNGSAIDISQGTAASTSGTPLLNVQNSGNVGLGINSPLARLHVKNPSGSSAFPATSGTSQSVGHYARFEDGSNLLLDMGGFGANGNWLQSTDRTNLGATYPLLLNPNGGNVGIGTTAPSSQLANNNGNTIASDSQGINGGTFNWVNSTNSTGWAATIYNSANVTQANGLAVKVTNGAGGALDVSRQASQSIAGTCLFNVQNNGNVGVGTNAPSGKLHIYEATGTVKQPYTGTLLLEHGNAGGASSIVFKSKNNNNSDSAYIQYQDDETVGGTGEKSKLVIGTGDDGAGGFQDDIILMPSSYVGIGTMTPTSLLHVNGVITATKIQGPSDSRFKKNIKPIENALEKVMKLGGYTYDWKDASEFPTQSLGKGHDMGVIAQEVEKQFPEAVSTNADGFKAVSYTELVPALIEAIKTQQAQISAQNAEIKEMKATIANLKK